MLRTAQKTVLVAEDDIADSRCLEEIIGQLDKSIKVDLVSNGPDVLYYLARRRPPYLPCLVILDFGLPALNGVEVLGALRTERRYAEIPKVIWSSLLNNQLTKLCIEAGAAFCFPKPERASELKVIARHMLELCHLAARVD